MEDGRTSKFWDIECPVKYLIPLIDKYGLDKVKSACVESEDNPILIKNKQPFYDELNFTEMDCIGFISSAGYIYSEKLKDYCIHFECVLWRSIIPKSYELELYEGTFYICIKEKE